MPLPWLLPLAKAVAPGLLSGLFRNKTQTTTSSVDYEKMRKSAEAAGFNPLTALRNGGSSGFTTMSTPVLSSKEFIGEALGAGLQTAFNYKDMQRDEERDQLETELMREQLKEMQRSSNVVRDRNFGYQIPSATTYTGSSDARNSSTKPTPSNSDPLPNGPPLRVAGGVVRPSSAFSDSEEIERRWGDVASSIYGVSVISADAGRNLGDTVDKYRASRKMRAIYRKVYPERFPQKPLLTPQQSRRSRANRARGRSN